MSKSHIPASPSPEPSKTPRSVIDWSVALEGKDPNSFFDKSYYESSKMPNFTRYEPEIEYWFDEMMTPPSLDLIIDQEDGKKPELIWIARRDVEVNAARLTGSGLPAVKGQGEEAQVREMEHLLDDDSFCIKEVMVCVDDTNYYLTNRDYSLNRSVFTDLNQVPDSASTSKIYSITDTVYFPFLDKDVELMEHLYDVFEGRAKLVGSESNEDIDLSVVTLQFWFAAMALYLELGSTMEEVGATERDLKRYLLAFIMGGILGLVAGALTFGIWMYSYLASTGDVVIDSVLVSGVIGAITGAFFGATISTLLYASLKKTILSLIVSLWIILLLTNCCSIVWLGV